MSIPRPLLYTWSDEELRLATGSGGVTHVQHQLKLFSAYLGVPVRCLNLLILLYFLLWLRFPTSIGMLQLICSNEVNYYALDEFWGWYLTQEIFQIFDVGFFKIFYMFPFQLIFSISFNFLQGSSWTRDSWEPLATLYHFMFIGTVD